MNRRRRVRRRMLVLIAAAMVLVTVGVIFTVAQKAARQAMVADARTLGLTALEQGRYADAVRHLSFFTSHDRSDASVLLAFAEARSKVPVENNRHLKEAAQLYIVATDLQPENISARVQLMHLYERLQRRMEWRETADRILQMDPNNREALRARAMAMYLDSQFDQAQNSVEKLISLDPNEMTWRVFYLQIMQDRGDELQDIVRTCQLWSENENSDGRYDLLQAQLLTAVGQREQARAAVMAAADRGADEQIVLEHLVAMLDMLSLNEQATQLIVRTKKRFPQEQWAHEASVRRLWKSGNFDEAMQEIQQVSAEHDRLGGGLIRWKYLLQMSSHDVDQFAFDADMAAAGRSPLTLNEDRDKDLAWTRAAMGRAQLQASNLHQAIELHREALALDPNDPVLHFLAAEAYARAGEHHLAATTLKQIVRQDPGWITARALYAKTLLKLERFDEAAMHAAELIRLESSPGLDSYIVLAQAWLLDRMTPQQIGLRVSETGRFVTLIQLLEHVREQAPDDPRAIELLVRAYLHEGQTAEATALIEMTLQRPDLTTELLASLVELHATHDLQIDSGTIQSAIDQRDPQPQLAAIRARVLHRSGMVELARAIIDQLPRDSGESCMARASYYTWANDSQAVAALHDVLNKASELESVSFVLSQQATWRDQELARRAIALLEDHLAGDSARVVLVKAAFTLRFQRDDPAALARAILRTNEVIDRIPDSLAARKMMAMLHLAGDQPDLQGAIAHLAHAIRTYPRRVDLYPRIIRLLQRQGDYLAAEGYLAAMGRLIGNNPTLAHVELQLLQRQGDLDAVISRLSDESPHGDVSQRVAMATAWHRAGNTAQAAMLFEQLLSSEPDNPTVLAAIADFYVDHGQAQSGLDLLTGYESRRQSGIAAMLLGVFHQRLQQTEQAGHWLDLALQRSPERMEIWHHLAGHYLAQGHYQQAHDIAKEGLQIHQEHVGLLTTFATAAIHLGGEARVNALRELEISDCRTEALAATMQLYDRVVAAQRQGSFDAILLSDLRTHAYRHPEYPGAWRLAITSHAQAGELHGAKDLAVQAVTRLPAMSDFAEMATHILIEVEDFPAALQMARTWRQRSLHQPIFADTAIAALHLHLTEPRNAADRLATHADRILTEREQWPQRLALLLRAYAADRRFDPLEKIAPVVVAEDARWSQLLLDLAGTAPAADAAILQQLARSPHTQLPQPN